MAIIGTIATGIYSLGFPWSVIVSGLIVWGTLSLSGYPVKLTLMTAAIALLWNQHIRSDSHDYNFLDLGMNGVMAHFALEVL